MSTTEDTIAALLTPMAPGAIAVIGLAGADTPRILRDILRKPRSDETPEIPPGKPVLCRIVDEGSTLDDAVVAVFPGDSRVRAEINIHGGVRIVQRTLMLLARHGAAIVEPTAYARRTTTDSVEHDVDLALLRSNARRHTTWLLYQRTHLSSYLARWYELPPVEKTAYRERTQAAIRLVRGLSIALVGPPNAGKSTLANRLIGDERIITSHEPGTTRDWVDEIALIQGWPVTLTDTAGLRETACEIESEAIRRTGERARQADLVLIVLDQTSSLDNQMRAIHSIIKALPNGQPRMAVVNKCDQPPHEEVMNASDPYCRVSAQRGDGIEYVEQQIEKLFGLDLLRDESPTGFLPSHLPA